MANELMGALTTVAVALLTSIVTILVWWGQTRRDREKWNQEMRDKNTEWLVTVKSNFSLELYKTRLTEYPKLIRIVGKLSNRDAEPLTEDKLRKVGMELNGWLYSAGGMSASKELRGAIIGLRESCLTLQPFGEETKLLYPFRNMTLFMLRHDLDLIGLEAYDYHNLPTMLEALNADMGRLRSLTSSLNDAISTGRS